MINNMFIAVLLRLCKDSIYILWWYQKGCWYCSYI